MKKAYPIQIYFLDNNLELSAQYQTNKSLSKSINGCIQALLATRFYFIGIRNKKYYKYYFDKLRYDETMDRFFPLWPIKQKPSFIQYMSKESKWTRKCAEHYNFIKNYLDILFCEYLYRFGKDHKSHKIIEWLDFDAPKINIPCANLKQITLPWKVINIRCRRKNIIDGYRLQFMKTLDGNPMEAYLKTKRDIPEFVEKFFNLQNEKYLI